MDRSHFRLARHWTLRGLAFGALGTLGLAAPAHDGDAETVKKAAGATAPRRPVDLAICLDTSGSMDGLIDAARQKIWSIVNDLALATPTPRLRIALLTYGNDGHDAERGWVAVDAPFTEDLDTVSAKLFALKTNGGTELVARVLDAASRLVWSEEKDALKLIVVAGNESAEQDSKLDFRNVCKNLVEHGVLVDSIYCGNPADGLAPAWKEVAQRADGQFAAIDQQNGTVTISTPFDSELAALSNSINDTYLWFGAAGAAACENQKAQDSNASGANAATCAARAMTKGGAAYWSRNDLVDAVKAGTVKVEEVKKEELPEKMREMTTEQKQKCIDDAGLRRAEIAKKIQESGAKRDAYVAEEMKKQAKDDKNSFDRAVRDAVRQQAATRGFKFPEDPKQPAPSNEAPKSETPKSEAPRKGE